MKYMMINLISILIPLENIHSSRIKSLFRQYWDLIKYEDNIYGAKNYLKAMNYYINGLIQYKQN